MYFSSHRSLVTWHIPFRCYFNPTWKDCVNASDYRILSSPDCSHSPPLLADYFQIYRSRSNVVKSLLCWHDGSILICVERCPIRSTILYMNLNQSLERFQQKEENTYSLVAPWIHVCELSRSTLIVVLVSARRTALVVIHIVRKGMLPGVTQVPHLW